MARVFSMRAEAIILVVITLFSAATLGDGGECSFPVEWQGVEWWTHYTTSVNVKEYTSSNTLTWDDKGDTIVAADIECLDGSGDTSKYAYLMRFVILPTILICVEETLGDVGVSMMRRYQYVTYDETETAASCSARFGSETELQWHLKYPFNLTQGSSPLQEGVYYTTYEAASGTVMCEGDSDSITTVTSNTLMINTCYTGESSYALPLKKNLTVVDHVPASVIDSAAYGNAMLLADESDTSKPRFYCARYAEVNGKFLFSLNGGDSMSASCFVKKSYTESGTDFIAFVLSNNIASMTTAAPTTAAPTTVAHTTAAHTTAAPTTVATTTVAPTTIAMTTAAPTTASPTTVSPTTVAPTTVAPTTVMPTTAAPTTVFHTTAAHTTDAPTTVAHTTAAPTTAAPTTVAHTTAAPTTAAPTAVAHTTAASTTAAPTTVAHTTAAHTTAAPTTVAHTTASHTTAAPTTVAHTTAAPTTVAHTTAAHTTAVPSTAAPTTAAHTTAFPTTAAPTTSAPTTAAPTTAAHTTAAPTTAHTTAAPTTAHTTAAYTTAAHTAADYTTAAPTTAAPTTAAHTTAAQTTAVPTTAPSTTTTPTSDTTATTSTTVAPTTSASTSTSTSATTTPDATTTTPTTTPAATTTTPTTTPAATTTTPTTTDATTTSPITTSTATTTTPTTSAATTTTPTTTTDATTTTPTTTTTSTATTTTPTTTTTTTTGPVVTTAAPETSQHVQVTANNDFDQTVGDNQEGTNLLIKEQIADQTGANRDQIENVATSPGSVVIDFDVVPGSGTGRPVADIVTDLQSNIQQGSLLLTTSSGDRLQVDPASLRVQDILSGGPCSSSPCENGGICTSLTSVTFQCDCLLPYSGSTCSTDGVLPTPDMNSSVLIGLIVGLSASVVLIFVIGVASCIIKRNRRSKPNQLPLVNYEGSPYYQGGGPTIAKSWSVSYVKDNNSYVF